MNTRPQKEIRAKIVECGRWLYTQGLVSGASGNLSARLDDRHLLVTPSGRHKGRLNPEDLLIYDMRSGRAVDPETGRPSSEIRLHVLVYRRRPDIQAVIHAHPPYAVALSVAGISFQKVVLPEALLALGSIVDCRYAAPTTEDVAHVIEAPILKGCNALVLARHGSVTLGKTIDEAFCRLETLEHVAKVTAIARSMGPVGCLSNDEIDQLEKL